MSDEEEGWMNDDAEENEQEERKETKTTDSKPKGPRKEDQVVEKTEAQQILEAKLKKQEEDDGDRIREIEEARRLEREKEDEELRKLKEKQAQRKKERELEDQKLEEQRRHLEEKRKQEEEARKQKTEEDKRRKQEILEQKKAAAQAAMVGGRNFVIEKDKESGSTIDKFMNISKAKTEMSLNTGELQALKMRTINERVKPLALSDLDNVGLKAKAEELWKTIVVLETSKYDLAERATRQEYDLKELNERQRQMNVKKHVAQGLDADAANSRYPPKVQLISKYERRTDRRTFGERKAIFEMEKKRLEELELVKPAAKKREGWVTGKKPAGDDGEENEDEENNGQENEEPNQGENQEEEEEEVQAEPADEEESIW